MNTSESTGSEKATGGGSGPSSKPNTDFNHHDKGYELPGGSDVIGRLAQTLNKAKGAWLDRKMQELLPPHILEFSKMNKGRARMKVAQYISRLGLRVHEYPDHTELRQGDLIISQFRVLIDNGKVLVQEKKAPSPIVLPPDIELEQRI